MQFSIDRDDFLRALRTAYKRRSGSRAKGARVHVDRGRLHVAYLTDTAADTGTAEIPNEATWFAGEFVARNAAALLGWVRDAPGGTIRGKADQYGLRLWSSQGDFAELYA
jgi:hypothetical protein